MPHEDFLVDLSQDFTRFATQSTEPDTAIVHLTAVYAQSEPSLETLLGEYYQGLAVFYALMHYADISKQTRLVQYLVGINDNILTMPLQQNLPRPTSLLRFFLTKPSQYHEMIQWVTMQKPHLLESENRFALDTKRVQQASLLSIAIKCLVIKQYEKFSALMAGQSHELIRTLLTANNNELLNCLLVSPVGLLKELIEQDISIALIPFESKTLYEYFSGRRFAYQSILGFINEKLSSRSVHKHSILEQNVLLQLSIDKSVFGPYNQKLRPYIDIDRVIPPSVLSLYLHTFDVLLQTQKILIMDTICDSKALSLSKIQKIKDGEVIQYTSNVLVDGKNLVPIYKEKVQKGKPDYILWPICRRDEEDYALFILDLTDPTATISSKGYYIEPFSRENRSKRLSQLGEKTQSLDSDTLSTLLYADTVKKITEQLDMKPSDFSYINLNQDPSYPWSSELITAIIIRLAFKSTMLIQSDRSFPTSLFALENTNLNQEKVLLLRLLRIQLLGEDYFYHQFPEQYKTEANIRFLSQHVLSQAPVAPKLSSADSCFFAKPQIASGSLHASTEAPEDDRVMDDTSLAEQLQAMQITITKTQKKPAWKPPAYRINPSPLGLFVEPRYHNTVSDTNDLSKPILRDDVTPNGTHRNNP